MLLDSIGQSAVINRTASNFNNANEKVQKIKRIINTGEYDKVVARYIPGTLDLAYQVILENIDAREQLAHIFYQDMENLELQIILTRNYYTNPKSMHICFLTKIKKQQTKILILSLT